MQPMPACCDLDLTSTGSFRRWVVVEPIVSTSYGTQQGSPKACTGAEVHRLRCVRQFSSGRRTGSHIYQRLLSQTIFVCDSYMAAC
jgi:hypothetical protein